ncbi:hypothetical protein CEXT_400881 [Caerostris extrusa]|uniref:Uncharacterized protein n=1 Tax=Caerostris extrusa TaxID=172846 RepID=A0AAV4WMV5_CAEEX|nr:hypothetical protein CEXT_400881 [Caerostris extrusa]
MDSYDNLRISKMQRENSYVNNKCYPKQPEYQKSDKKQYYLKFLRWNMEKDILFIVTEPINEALPKTIVNQFYPRFLGKVDEILLIYYYERLLIYIEQIPSFMLWLRRVWSNKGKMSKM